MTATNTVVPVGNGFLMLIDEKIPPAEARAIKEFWASFFPGIPLIVAPDARLVQLSGKLPVFDFGGDVTREWIDEFKEWWAEASAKHEVSIPAPPDEPCTGC